MRCDCPLPFSRPLSIHSRYGLHARRVAKRPSTPKAPTGLLLCYLRRRFDCFYRVERTRSRAGVSPAGVQRLSRRTVSTVKGGMGGYGNYWFAICSNSALRRTLLPLLTFNFRSQSLKPFFFTETVCSPPAT